MRRCTLHVLGLIFVLCLFGFSSVGAVFVASNGNNTTGNGTIGNPFRTIQRAGTVISGGDTIYLRGGIYNQRDYIESNANGSPGQPVVIMNYNGEEVIFDGTSISLGNNEALVTMARWTAQPWMQHYVIEGITVRNSAQRGISYYKAEHLVIRNCKVHNIQKRCIGGFGHDVTITNNEAFNGSLINQNGALGSSGWPIQIHGTADWDSGAGSTDLVISNNLVYNSWGEGISPGMGTIGALIEGNVVHDVWSVGIYCDRTANVTIRNNHMYNTNSAYYRFGVPAHGISMANETSFEGIYPPISNIIIYNNLITNSRRGIGFWFDSSNSSSNNSYSNVLIAYNVIYNPAVSAIAIDVVPGGNTAPSGCILKNNILYLGSSQSEIGNQSAWSISHNNWVGGMPSFGQTSSFDSNPLFVSPGISAAPSGFMLSGPGSPCYAAGTPVPSVTESDFFGNTRDSSTPSIGFHELTSSGPVISVSGTLAPFSTVVNVPSAEQNYSVSGSNLTGEIVVTAPDNFQVSLSSGAAFSTTVTLVPAGGNVENTPVYLRYYPTTAGTHSGNVAHTSEGATQQNLAVSGSAGSLSGIIVSPALIAFGSVVSAQSAYSIIGNDLTGDITVTAPSGFQVSLTQGGSFLQSLVLEPVLGVVNSRVYVRFSPQATQAYTGNISNSSPGVDTVNVGVSGTGINCHCD